MTDASKNGSWKRMSFKGNKVWVELASEGEILLRSGKARIKYNLDQDYEYTVSPDSLAPESDAVASNKKKISSRKKAQEPGGGPRSFLPAKETVPPEDAILVYTDGASSGNPGPAGIGVVLKFGPHEKEISESIGDATNNIAELKAIRRALSEIKRPDLPVRIYTDSSYAVGLLTQGWKARANQELVNEIKTRMASFEDLKIIKVKGHAGDPGNERADTLATQGASRT